MIKVTKTSVNLKLSNRTVKLVGEYLGSMTKTSFQCEMEHTWLATPNNILNGNGCPECYGNLKYTKNSINRKLVPRGIELIGECVGNTTKTTFRCNAGHEWVADQGSVVNGNGCPHCSKRFPHTKDSINLILKERKIELIADYKGSLIKTTFQCPVGHQWLVTPDSVLRGHNCPYCTGNARLTKDLVNARLSYKQILLIGEYNGNITKTLFQCMHNHQWETRPTTLLRGGGCPKCSKSGFNPSKPAVIYIYHLTTINRVRYIGYGVSNGLETRRKQHKNSFIRANAQGELIHIFEFECGSEALCLEKFIKSDLALLHISSGIKGFIRESLVYSEDNMEQLLKIIIDFISNKK